MLSKLLLKPILPFEKAEVQRNCEDTGYHQCHSSVFFFLINFKICCWHLVLLEMISVEKKFKTAAQKFTILYKWSWCRVFVRLLLKVLADSFLEVWENCRKKAFRHAASCVVNCFYFVPLPCTYREWTYKLHIYIFQSLSVMIQFYRPAISSYK